MAKNTTPNRPLPPKAPSPTHEPDLSLIPPERLKELRDEAEAKVKARFLVEAEQAFLAKEMTRLEREKYPVANEEMRQIRPDLALYADRVTLDGKIYYHGELYTVPKSVYDVIKECEQASRRHEEEIHGDDDQAFYKRDRERYKLNFRTGQTSPGSLPRF